MKVKGALVHGVNPSFETVFGGTLFASVVQSQILSRLGKVDDRVREHRRVAAKSRDKL